MQMTENWFYYTSIFFLGTIVGSFLNVCIYRIPHNASIVRPLRSCCRYCRHPIHWYDNIPLFSWIGLRGRCRKCRTFIGLRYPLVEGLTGFAFLWCRLRLPPVLALLGMIFVSLLIVAAFIDWDHRILPDRLTIGGAILGVSISYLFPVLHGVVASEGALVDSVRSGLLSIVGVLLGSGLLLWIAFIGEVVCRKEVIGLGDVAFLGCIGAFCGWQGAFFALFGGAFCGTIVLLPLVIWQRIKQNKAIVSAKSSDFIPFGPWLAIGAALYFLFFREEVRSVLQGVSYLGE